MVVPGLCRFAQARPKHALDLATCDFQPHTSGTPPLDLRVFRMLCYVNMSKSDSDAQHSIPLLEIVLALIRADFATVVVKFILPHLPRLLRQLPGAYEVLEYETKLDLLDPDGKLAVYSKHQKVQFLQDNVIAFQDQAWGDGEIFADYKCSPGYPVDRYRDGNKYRILISLRETKNRGDIENFHIERTIKDGFVRPIEDYQVDVDHSTRRLSLTVVFPKERTPKQVKLIEQKSQRSKELSTESLQPLPDGRWQITWETEKAKLHEVYILRWEW